MAWQLETKFRIVVTIAYEAGISKVYLRSRDVMRVMEDNERCQHQICNNSTNSTFFNSSLFWNHAACMLKPI